jgi:hypothetical protein
MMVMMMMVNMNKLIFYFLLIFDENCLDDEDAQVSAV